MGLQVVAAAIRPPPELRPAQHRRVSSWQRWSSVLVMGLFWQPSFVIGAAVDVGILVGLLCAHWPTPTLVGA